MFTVSWDKQARPAGAFRLQFKKSLYGQEQPQADIRVGRYIMTITFERHQQKLSPKHQTTGVETQSPTLPAIFLSRRILIVSSSITHSLASSAVNL